MEWTKESVEREFRTIARMTRRARHGLASIWYERDDGWHVVLSGYCHYRKMDAAGAAWVLNHLGVAR